MEYDGDVPVVVAPPPRPAPPPPRSQRCCRCFTIRISYLKCIVWLQIVIFCSNFFFQQARGWINILQVSGRTTFVMSACAVERIFLRSSVPQQLFSLSLLFFLFVFTILLFAVQKHIYCSYLNCVTSSKGFFCTSLSCFIVSLAIRGGDFHYKATHAIHAIGSDRIASKEMGKIRRINHFVTGLGGNTNRPN